MSWFQDVVLWPGAEHLEGPSESSAHLLFAEKLYFGTEAPLGPGRHAVVDSVGGALLQSVHSDRLPWRNTEQQVEGHTLINWALVRCRWLTHPSQNRNIFLLLYRFHPLGGRKTSKQQQVYYICLSSASTWHVGKHLPTYASRHTATKHCNSINIYL